MKKKFLALTLVMSMCLSMSACGNTNTKGSESEPTVSSDVQAPGEVTPEGSNGEASDAAPADGLSVTEDDVRSMMLALNEQMQENLSMTADSYVVDAEKGEVSKMMTMQFSQNDSFSYVKIAAPTIQMEVFSEEDGHLYVDMSAETAEEGADTSEAYFDGTRYHQLSKAEPKEGEESGESSVSEIADSMENPVDDFDSDTNFVIYNQVVADGYTIVATAFDHEGAEQHMLLYIKDDAIEKIVVSAAAEDAAPLSTGEQTASATEAYAVMYLNVSAPDSIPAYFDTVEFTDADEVGMTAAFGMMAVMFSMMGEEDGNGETIVPTGEWAANAGGLTMSEVEEIRTLLDVDTQYLTETTTAA